MSPFRCPTTLHPVWHNFHGSPGLFPQVRDLSQEVRDRVGSALLRLTLKELFDWRFMQTDPNWGNFLYNAETDVIHLIDFGASREYPKAFVDEYLMMVRACAEKDGPAVMEHSTTLGFLTGAW